MSLDLLTALSEDWAALLDNDTKCDVTLYAGEEPNIKEFWAHSLVLRARCSYFRAAISNERARKDSNYFEFRKPNIHPELFEDLLKYIYTGTIDLSTYEGAKILKLIVAADELDLQKLINHIQNYIIEEKTAWLKQDPVEILEIVFQHAACKSLRDYCLQAICRKPDLVFGSNIFLHLDESILILLLKRDDLAMEEVDIWGNLVKWGVAQNPLLNQALPNWTKENFATLEATLYQFLPLVRWFQIPKSDFSRKVRPYKSILDPELYEDILSYHLDPECNLRSTILPPRYPILESSIITPKVAAHIASWIDGCDDAYYRDRRFPYSFKQLLRGSRDGFDSATFHRLCDHQGPTVIVAKVDGTERILGGYNPLDWMSEGDWQSTKDSFIFSFDNDTDFETAYLSRIEDFNHAVYFNLSNGPTFGIGNDLSFVDQTWSSKQSSYPNIFQDLNGNVDDYEVFRISKN